MARLMRVVPADLWVLSTDLDSRRARLIDAIRPEGLLHCIAADAQAAAEHRAVPLCWQESTDEGRAGYFRLSAQVPLTESTFDQFFNGNSGYRAQYYLSPEEGILYNHDAIGALLPSIEASYQHQPLRVPLEFVQRSLQAPHAKIWVFNEIPAFDSAAPEGLNPPRWVKHNASRGRRAPLPGHLMLDLKGAFINFATNDLYVCELKLDRATDLFRTGYT
jgi:hypothetical protein